MKRFRSWDAIAGTLTSRYYLVIWEFQVGLESQSAFERIYGCAGDWADLFSQSPNYGGTRLLRDLDRPGRYLTFDYWASREALHEFKQAHQADYDAFDQQCESLTETESLLGEFELLSASPSEQPVTHENL